MKKYLTYYIKFIISFGIALILLEFFLRFSEVSLPSIVVNDPKYGTRFKPQAKVMAIKEGFFMGRINGSGYIGPNYSIKKNDATLRIAIIGDSYIEGFQLFDKYSIRNILEDELSKKLNMKVEVLNFGMSGLNFNNMYIIYQKNIVKYKPDITLFFINYNDLLSTKNVLGPSVELINDSLQINYTFSESETSKGKLKLDSFRNLAMYSLIQSSYSNIRAGNTANILLDKFRWILNSKNKFDEIEKPENDNSKQYQLNTRIIKELFIENDKSNNFFIPFKGLPSSYKNFIDKNNILDIDVSSFVESLKNSGIDPYYWESSKKFGHWNHTAHNEIGKYIALELSKYIINKKNFSKLLNKN